MQILCVVSQKYIKLLGDFIPPTPYRGCVPEPCWGLPSPDSSLLLSPPIILWNWRPWLIPIIPLVFALAFYNELEYCHLDKYTSNSDDAATSCKNLMNISPRHNDAHLCTFQGRRSHRIIGGHKRRLGIWGTEVPHRGPGPWSPRGSGGQSPPKAEYIFVKLHIIFA